MIEERLVELETQITFQDQTIKDLSDVIYKQQQELEIGRASCRERVSSPV